MGGSEFGYGAKPRMNQTDTSASWTLGSREFDDSFVSCLVYLEAEKRVGWSEGGAFAYLSDRFGRK